MGMGYQGEMALVLDKEKVEALVPEPYAAFLTVLDKHERNFNGFARVCSLTDTIEMEELGSDEQEVVEEMLQSFSAVSAAFKEKTGISLYFNYHNSQEVGDVWDEVDGGFYCLDSNEVYRLTEKARELHKSKAFNVAHYVTDTTGLVDEEGNPGKTGYVSCFTLKLHQWNLKRLIGEPFISFLSKLEEYGMDFDEFAEAVNRNVKEFEFPKAVGNLDKEAATAEILNLHRTVLKAFEDKTGLSLVVKYHDPKTGCKLDAVSGGHYSLYFSEVFEMTEGGKALKELVPFELQYFVVMAG